MSSWPGYTVNTIDLLSDFLDFHRERLTALKGRRLEKFWFVWSDEYNEWWVDAPVVLDFEGTHLEFQGTKCMISVSWDSLRLSDPHEPFLKWVHAIPEHSLDRILGQRVQEIIPLSYGEPLRVRGLYFTFKPR